MPSTVQPILRSGGLMLVGEAAGAQEAKFGLPFMGNSGQLLDQMLAMAGTSRGNVSLTNVFDTQPENNNLDSWGIPLASAQKFLHRMNESPEYLTPVYGNKLVINPTISVPALKRLRAEIAKVQPNCIVALGNTALRALCGVSGIGKRRGAIHHGHLYPAKVLPTYHPSAILRQFENLPVAVLDLRKALVEAEYPELRQFTRRIHIPESRQDLHAIRDALASADYITFDIETKARQMTCIGINGGLEDNYVIPFWCRGNGGNYWPQAADELEAIRVVKDILESDVPKIAQNGIYDIQYLMTYGIAVRNYYHDTMLLQHSMFPSLPKGLDFLGSLYCNERAWKRMRPRKGDISGKKEE